jgi:hypothetical protein
VTVGIVALAYWCNGSAGTTLEFGAAEGRAKGGRSDQRGGQVASRHLGQTSDIRAGTPYARGLSIASQQAAPTDAP